MHPPVLYLNSFCTTALLLAIPIALVVGVLVHLLQPVEVAGALSGVHVSLMHMNVFDFAVHASYLRRRLEAVTGNCVGSDRVLVGQKYDSARHVQWCR